MLCDHPQCKKEAKYWCSYCQKAWCLQHSNEDDGGTRCPECGNPTSHVDRDNGLDMPYTEPFK